MVTFTPFCDLSPRLIFQLVWFRDTLLEYHWFNIYFVTFIKKLDILQKTRHSVCDKTLNVILRRELVYLFFTEALTN